MSASPIEPERRMGRSISLIARMAELLTEQENQALQANVDAPTTEGLCVSGSNRAQPRKALLSRPHGIALRRRKSAGGILIAGT
jgi:hypothetical protein